MRRSVGTTALLSMVLAASGFSIGVVGAQVEVQAFCQSRADLAAAVAQEDGAAAQEAVDSLAANAPIEVQAQATTLAALVTKHGHAAFQMKNAGKVTATIDQHAAANCGFPVLAVSAIDYGYQGISGPLTAGPYVIEFTNDAPAEHHELVLSRVDAGVTLPVKKLLALSTTSASRIATTGAAFAKPGGTDTLIVFLEPGRYVYACFIGVGTTSGGDQDPQAHGGEHGATEHGAAAKPHWKQGMRGELEVVGGA